MERVGNGHYSYHLPVIKGIQAGREIFTTMCSLETVCKITMFNEEGLPPDFRAQRKLNNKRIPEITRYILENPTSYVFSALTVSVDSSVRFKPSDDDPLCETGVLIVPVSARFVINDGQHRRAAIVEALKINQDLANQSIPLVIFVDSDLGQSQQMFADLNRYATRPSKSLSILYDRRDPIVSATLEMISAVPLFRGAVEFEKTSLSNRSTKLFTLSNVHQATCKLLEKTKGQNISQQEKALATDFWTALAIAIPEWKAYTEGHTKSGVLRKEYVHSHGVVLVSLGLAGNSLIHQYPHNWKGKIVTLASVDWKRSNVSLWEGVALEGGKVSKAHRNLKLTSMAIKEILGVNLSNEEIEYRKKSSIKRVRR